jgi:hypothetical protein
VSWWQENIRSLARRHKVTQSKIKKKNGPLRKAIEILKKKFKKDKILGPEEK